MAAFRLPSDPCCRLLSFLSLSSACALLGMHLMKLLFARLMKRFDGQTTSQLRLGSLVTYGASCPKHLDWQSRCEGAAGVDGLFDLG